MRLLNIHIDDFGKISNLDLDFTMNPVVISQENGWGKSTLAAFIRIMFYGFDGEGKKKLTERERVKYKPWNKGNFGGRIIFEVDGREYELTRHFGDKEKDDSGSLVDMATMLGSSVYDLKNIGEQIFGLDGESFTRTVFVGQGKTEVLGDSDSISNGITAKIGNLTDATDDIYSYEKVHDKLLSKSRELKSGYKLGIINELKNKKTELEKSINSKAALEQSVEQTEKMLREEEKLIKQYRKKAEDLDREFMLSGKRDAFELDNQKGQELRDERNRLEDALKECRDYIPGGIPSQAEIDMISDKVREAEQLRALQKDYLNSGTMETEVPGDIDSSKIDEAIEKLKFIEEQRNRIQELEYEISSKRQRLEFTNEQRRLIYERKLQDEQNRYRLRISEAKNRIKGQAFALMLSAMSLLILAVIGYFFVSTFVAVTLLFISIALFGTGIIRRVTGIRKVEGTITPSVDIEKPQQEELGAEIYRLQNERDRIQQQKDELADELKLLLNSCKIEYDLSTASQKLYGLRESLGKKALNEQKNLEYQKQCELLKGLEQELLEWFKKTGVSIEADYLTTLREIGRIVIRYAHFENDLENVIARQKAWEETSKASEGDVFDEVRPMNVIEEDRKSVAELITQSEKNIRIYVNQLEGYREKLDVISEDEEQLALISEKIDESNHKYDIILETVKYMEQAKAGLNSRYMQPISDAFKKYYGYISEEDQDFYLIDANINVTKSEYGERRSASSLSKGYQDLVDVSLRMALLDAMYKGEKPFVILDDPFVNLDTEKISRAKEFLKRIAKDYQVIYFTCHESRA